MTRIVRNAVLAFLCGLAFAADAVGQAIVIDVATRRVETSHLLLRFNATNPERLDEVVFKDYSPTTNLRGEGGGFEFYGQMIRGVWASQGFIDLTPATQSWEVLSQDDSTARIRIRSTSAGQPPVETIYTVFADSTCYLVYRTIRFSQVPVTSAFQIYVPRVAPSSYFSQYRYRRPNGTLAYGGHCSFGCALTDWDQRWSQNLGAGLAVTIMYAPFNSQDAVLVTDYDSNSNASWTAPMTPAAAYTTDRSYGVLIDFSLARDDLTRLDDLYAWLGSLQPTAVPTGDAAPGAPPTVLRLYPCRPNPFNPRTTIKYDLPESGPVRLSVFDVAGRLIRTLVDDSMPQGTHEAVWDGRDASGREVGSGSYLARLESGGKVEVVRMGLVR